MWKKNKRRTEEKKNNHRTIELKLPYFLLNDEERSQHSRQLFSITSDMRKHIKLIVIKSTVFLYSFHPTYFFRAKMNGMIELIENDQYMIRLYAQVSHDELQLHTEHIAYLNAYCSIQYLLAYFHCLLLFFNALKCDRIAWLIACMDKE